MSGAQSISTRRAYGVQRVCRVWARPRSSVYARRQAPRDCTRGHRRGPVGAAPDEVLVVPHSPGARGVAVSWRGGTGKSGQSCGSRGFVPQRSEYAD